MALCPRLDLAGTAGKNCSYKRSEAGLQAGREFQLMNTILLRMLLFVATPSRSVSGRQCHDDWPVVGAEAPIRDGGHVSFVCYPVARQRRA